MMVTRGTGCFSRSLEGRAVSELARGVIPVTRLGHRTGGDRDVRLSSAVT